jgi:hypothetical protein
MPTRFFRAVALLCAAALTGCAASNDRIAIHGTVTYKGGPVQAGTVTFSPKEQTKGTMEAATITDGKYALPSGKGLFPGTYLVSVSSPDTKGAPAGDAPPGASRHARELIPERHNKKSTRTIEVSAGGTREFNFDLD